MITSEGFFFYHLIGNNLGLKVYSNITTYVSRS